MSDRMAGQGDTCNEMAMKGELSRRHGLSRDRQSDNALVALQPQRDLPIGRDSPPHVQRIIVSLFLLNYWTRDTLYESARSYPPLVDWDMIDQFKQDVTFLGSALAGKGPEIYMPDWILTAREYHSRLCYSQHQIYIGIEYSYKYYSQLVQLRTTKLRAVKEARNRAERVGIVEAGAEREFSMGPDTEALEHSIVVVNRETHRLKAVVEECSQLCKNARQAILNNELDLYLTTRLRLVLAALQRHFQEACAELDLPKRGDLVDMKQFGWWDLDEGTSEAPSDATIDAETPPDDAVEAYEPTYTTGSRLNFFIPLISILSCIPAAMAWTHAMPQVGTHTDAEFYQQLSGSSMQLLSLATLIWPTIFSTRLARLNWTFAWCLAGASATCSVAAVPLYIVAPTAWSAVVAFGGAVAQALVVLQLVHSI